jgi:hypothetical protein
MLFKLLGIYNGFCTVIALRRVCPTFFPRASFTVCQLLRHWLLHIERAHACQQCMLLVAYVYLFIKTVSDLGLVVGSESNSKDWTVFFSSWQTMASSGQQRCHVQ